jgi:hypothetical protein
MTLRSSTARMHLFATITRKLLCSSFFKFREHPRNNVKKIGIPNFLLSGVTSSPHATGKLRPAISRKRGCCGHIPTMVPRYVGQRTTQRFSHKDVVKRVLEKCSKYVFFFFLAPLLQYFFMTSHLFYRR